MHQILYELNDLDTSSFNDLSKFEFGSYGLPKMKIYNKKVVTSQYPELLPIYKKFKNARQLFDFAEVMYVPPHNYVMPHIDADRYCAINIPVLGDFENSYLAFFNKGEQEFPNLYEENGEMIQKNGGAYPDATIDYKVSYTYPTLINVSKIHNVINETEQNRIVLSLTFKQEHRYEDILDLYNNGELLW